MNIFSCRWRFPSEFPEKRVWEGPGENPQASEAPKEGEESGEKCAEETPPAEKRHELAAELNKEGEAKDYVETFKKSGMFDVFASSLEYAKNFPEVEGFQNFEDWTVTDPQALAEFFATCNLVPNGKGKTAFIEGLKGCPKGECKTPEAQEAFDKSRKTLTQLMELLREYEKMKRESRVDTRAQVGKSAMGKTVGGGIETLLKNFNRASGTEKLMILGSIGIGIAILYKMKDAALPGTGGKIKYSSLFMGLGAILGVNYLSGKISKDGKSLLQRFDLFRDVDELKDENAMRGFAEHHNLAGNQEKLRTLLRVQGLSIKELYRLYKEASGTDDRSIDPKKVGFQKQEIDGKSLYEIVDLLVQITSLNEAEKAAREDAEKGNVPYSGLTDEAKAEARMPGNARAAFESKYFHGELSRADLTVFDVISNEYTMTAVQQALREGKTPDAIWRQHIEEGKAQRLPDRTWEYGKRGFKWTYERAKHYGGEAVKWSWEKIKEGGIFVYDHALYPAYSWAAARWNRYAPKLEGYMMKPLAYKQQQDLEKVLPPEFDVRVTQAESDAFKPEVEDLGKATIMGVPNLSFAIFVRKDDGKEVAIIDNEEFLLDDGRDGNENNSNKLKQKLEAKVETIFDPYRKRFPHLHGLKPEWDSSKKKWKVSGVSLQGDTSLGIPAIKTGELHFTIEQDGTHLTFFDGDTKILDEVSAKKINNLSNLDDAHIDAEIGQAIIETDPKLKPILKGLSFKRSLIRLAPPTVEILGKFGDLEIHARPKQNAGGSYDIHAGLEFMDAGGNWGRFEKVLIDKGNGGPEFLDNLTGLILENPAFIGPFHLLEAQMENTGEGLGARLGELIKTRRLWIIPTNISGALQGKIFQKRWKYTLDFKMFETLDIFKHALEGKTLKDIPAVYDKFIKNANEQLTKLARYIDSLSDEDKANEFEALLTGNAVTGPNGSVRPAGLEVLNYHNDIYRDIFREYQKKITSERYDYEGIDKREVGTAYHEIYFTLLRVWSRWTSQFALLPNGQLKKKDEEYCRRVIDRVVQRLEIAQKDGRIDRDELPGKCKPDEESLDEWMK